MKAGELRIILDKITEKEDMTLSDIAMKANVNRSYLSKRVNGNADEQMTDGIIRKLRSKFPTYFPDSNKSNTGSSTEANIYNDTSVRELISSNKLLAEASLKQSERDRIKAEADKIREEKEKLLVQSNYNLGQMLESKAHLVPKAMIVDASRIVDLVEVLVELAMAAGVYSDEGEARRIIGIRLKVHESVKGNQAGTQTGAGKSNTVK